MINFKTGVEIKTPECKFLIEGFSDDELILMTSYTVYRFDIDSRTTRRITKSKEKLKHGVKYQLVKKDRKILYLVLKSRLKDHLPTDLIRLTFEQIM